MASGTPSLSPRTSPRASIGESQKPPVKEKLTIWNVLYTPGGSSTIKANLLHVYENREHRIYCIYKTTVTAVRSGIEIFSSTGKLLLNTATWFVDITSAREEGAAIFIRDFVDVIHCVKMTVLLPFHAIAGFISPSDIFELFRNMPGDQTKFAIADEKARLSQVIEKKGLQEKALVDAEAELENVKQELKRTDEALTQTKLQRGRMIQSIEKFSGAEEEANKLKTQIEELTKNLENLRSQEDTLNASVASITSKITKLGLELKEAQTSKTTILKNLEIRRSAAAEELKKVRTELQETTAKRQLTQNSFENLSNDMRDLQLKETTLKREITKLEERTPKLKTAETELLNKIEHHKAELLQLEEQVIAAKTKALDTLDALQREINTTEWERTELVSQIKTLQLEESRIVDNQNKLSNACRELQHTTLFSLNKDKEDLEKAINFCKNTKTLLETAIAEQKEELRKETDSFDKLTTKLKALTTTFEKLQQQELKLKSEDLQQLESATRAESEKVHKLEQESQAKKKELEVINNTIENAKKALEDIAEKTKAKQVEQTSLEESFKRLKEALQGSPAHGTTGSDKIDTQTIASLQKNLETLTQEITEKLEQNALLTGLIGHNQSTLDKQTTQLGHLTKQSESYRAKLVDQRKEVDELSQRHHALEEEIKNLEAKKKSLQDQTATLNEQANTLETSLKELASNQKKLEEQVAKATQNLEKENKRLEVICHDINLKERIKKEIEATIQNLEPKITFMKTDLPKLEDKKAKLEYENQQLLITHQKLTSEIDTAKSNLLRTKHLLDKANGDYDVKIKMIQEQQDQLTQDNKQLAKEYESKKAALNELQAAFETLTFSTQSLRTEETDLKASIDAAKTAKAEIDESIEQETEHQTKLQEQTATLSKQLQELAAKADEQAEHNQKLENDYNVRKSKIEEEFRNKEAALEAELAEIRKGSPKKALEKQNVDAEITRKKEEIEKLSQQATTLKAANAKVEKDVASRKKELEEYKQDIAATKKESQAYIAEKLAEITKLKTMHTSLKSEVQQAIVMKLGEEMGTELQTKIDQLKALTEVNEARTRRNQTRRDQALQQNSRISIVPKTATSSKNRTSEETSSSTSTTTKAILGANPNARTKQNN